MEEHGVEAKTVVDAKKETIDGKEAMQLAKKATRIHAAKGKKCLEFVLRAGKLQGDASLEDVEKAIVGPSGNLRAPTLFVGKQLYVGFSPELYEALA